MQVQLAQNAMGEPPGNASIRSGSGATGSASGHNPVGMDARAAMALVQSIAASPGHPKTHAEDLAQVAPLIGMFQAGLAPRETVPIAPHSPLGNLSTLSSVAPNLATQAVGSHARPPALNFVDILTGAQPVPMPNRAPAGPEAPRRTDDSLHVPAQRSSQPFEALPKPRGMNDGRPRPQPSTNAAANDEGDDAILDVLSATMDAWEEVLTARLTATVQQTVQTARREVMQVRHPAAPHLVASSCHAMHCSLGHSASFSDVTLNHATQAVAGGRRQDAAVAFQAAHAVAACGGANRGARMYTR